MLIGFPVRRPALTLLTLSGILLLAGCLPDSSERQTALRSLARWEDRRLAPQDSLTALLAHQDAHIRLAATRTAGLIGRADVLPAMIENLGDKSATVVRQAAFSLGLLGDAGAVPALEKAARDPHVGTRVAALRGLAQLPHPGQALLAAASSSDRDEAAAAWDGLRNLATSVDSTALQQAIIEGLGRQESDILWRVLRCSERAMSPALLPAIQPHLDTPHPQVKVHLYRALGRLDQPKALAAVIQAGQDHGAFRDRHRDRVDIAFLRAVGSLAHHHFALMDDGDDIPLRTTRDFLVTRLISGAGSQNPQVALTALQAMAQAVASSTLPAEAAEQESLLPVWRIRLARAARSHLEHPEISVRAAAINTWATLRGAGAGLVLETLLEKETEPLARVALLEAISRVHPEPMALLAPFANPGDETDARVRTTALTGLAQAAQGRQGTVPESQVLDLLTAGAADADFVVAATSADLLGDFPHRLSLVALAELWDTAAGPEQSDLQLAVLESVRKLGSVIPEMDRNDGYFQTLFQIILRESFDSTDIRVRYRGRTAALESGLLPTSLVPSRESLLATLPAFTRSPRQAPLTLPFAAPRVRCVTDKGAFIITLTPDEAPNTCANFLALIEQGFYENLNFHRVVPDFVAQGGCPRGDGWGGPGFTIRSEWSRLPYRRGAVGIAHSGKDTGGSQFFVTLSEQPHLNARYTVFGEVTDGMDVVDSLTIGDRFRLEIMP